VRNSHLSLNSSFPSKLSDKFIKMCKIFMRPYTAVNLASGRRQKIVYHALSAHRMQTSVAKICERICITHVLYPHLIAVYVVVVYFQSVRT